MTNETQSDPRVIDSPDAIPDWDAWDKRVKKMVIGKLDATIACAANPLPEDLWKRFPELTHLYIWGLEGLETLPKLPRSLVCLHVRGCANVQDVGPVRDGLEELVLDDLPSLRDLQVPLTLDGLRDLSLRSSTLPGETLSSLIEKVPATKRIDMSGSKHLDKILDLPKGLLDLRLSGCTRLRVVPQWPNSLRRLELRDTPLETVPELPPAIDYLDLGGMCHLRALPDGWKEARTLFLYGSAVLAPPASEHGEAVDENVAQRTRDYFADIDLVGKGAVQRCKVLVLGNGGDGKTCFSLALVGDNPKRTAPDFKPEKDRIGSTHGVLFHDWSVPTQAGGIARSIHCHVWDFGGQEIYHNTHRMFMGSGTVFVILWNPDASGDPPKTEDGAYQDRRRPLAYWFDTIEQACKPATAEIIVICSSRTGHDQKLLERMKAEADSDRLDEAKVFFADSFEQLGEFDEAKSAVERAIARVVESQGTRVPSYWEIAQDMVQEMVVQGESEEGSSTSRQVGFGDFRSQLEQRIRERAADFPKLKRALDNKADESFQLTDSRLERTLSFLTRSGWVYWNAALFERRIILGQRWALDGIYILLERNRDGRPSPVFQALSARGGRFTLEDLEEWKWSEVVTDKDERKLLLSFMERIGLIFPLIKAEESLWGRPVYQSLEHLKKRPEDRWASELNQASIDLGSETFSGGKVVLEHDHLHRGHWERVLRDLGRRFGTDGKYARDGFFCWTKKGQAIVILFDLEDSGFGGRITVDAIGGDADELEESVGRSIHAVVTADIDRHQPYRGWTNSVGDRLRKIQVFLSYAWEPDPEDKTRRIIPQGYEKPVDAIYAALDKESPHILPIRDRFVMGTGDSIVDFMNSITKSDHVVVIHSDRYWRSPNCVYELATFVQALSRRESAAIRCMTMISHGYPPPNHGDHVHQCGPLGNAVELSAIRKHWEDYPEERIPVYLLSGSRGAPNLLWKFRDFVGDILPDLIDANGATQAFGFVWNDSKAAQLIEEIKQRIHEGARQQSPPTGP